MPLGDAAKIWSLNYRVLLSVISSVEADITALGLDSKECSCSQRSTSIPTLRNWLRR